MSQHGFIFAIFAGVILSGILAATMSTADSQLLAAASSVSQDLAQDFLGIKLSSRQQMRAARLTVLFIAAISVVLAWNPNSSIFRVVSVCLGGLRCSVRLPQFLHSALLEKIQQAGRDRRYGRRRGNAVYLGSS